MSAEKELQEWLDRPEKTFAENLKFAIGVFNSLEFSLQTKYEVIFEWFSRALNEASEETVDIELVSKLVGLRFPQNLVSNSTKKKVVYSIKKYVNGLSGEMQIQKNIALLLVLSENHSYQSFYRINIKAYFKLQREIFSQYVKYFQFKEEFCPSSEATSYAKAIADIKQFVNHLSKIAESFGKELLDLLITSSLFMHSEKKFYAEIMEILKSVYFEKGELETFLKYSQTSRLSASFHCLDFAINHFRTEQSEIGHIIKFLIEDASTPKENLRRFSVLLELLSKYDIDITFIMDSEKTALQHITSFIEKSVAQHSQDNLKMILSLICSAIRLNPMILEKIMFKTTTEFILAHKNEEEWQQYNEYLFLTIDVFKKLGRSEKLVAYLIKSLRGQLAIKGLTNSLKRKSSNGESGPMQKYQKTEDGAAKQKPSIENDEQDDKLLSLFIPKMTRINPIAPKIRKWKYISMGWPAETVGKYFTEFVSTLVSKPSIVLWKTLTFALNDSIEDYRKAPTDEKNIILIEFGSALLSQYLEGSRLPEQMDKFGEEIKAARTVLQDTLRGFGRMILDFEHNNRIMDAFLEICLCVGTFDLITAYYTPESGGIDTPSLHTYITKDEWISLEQRIVNFGNNITKYNIKLLNIQHAQLRLLSSKHKEAASIDLSNYFMHYNPHDYKVVKLMVENQSNIWLLKQLSKEEKEKINGLFTTDSKEINLKTTRHLLEDRQFFELTVLRVVDSIKSCFESKKSVVHAIATDSKTEDIRDLILSKRDGYSIKHWNSEGLERILTDTIEILPLGYCSGGLKSKVFAFSLALYRDILATKSERLDCLCFDLLSDLLHFGPNIDVLAIFNLQSLMKMFSPTKHKKLYEIIFTYSNIWNATTQASLSDLYTLISAKKNELNDDEIVLTTTFLQFMHQCSSKNIKEIMGKFIELLVDYIIYYFDNLSGKNEEKDESFVKTTAIVMQLYPSHEHVRNKNSEAMSESIRHLYRKYIVRLRNDEAYLKLIGCAIQYRKQLGFDADEVDLILEEMWKRLLDDLVRGEFDENKTQKILKQVASQQNARQLIHMFSRIEEKLSSTIAFKISIFLTKFQLSTYMGTVLNSCCHKMMSNKIITLERNKEGCFMDDSLLLNILDLLEAICSAKKHPMSVNFIDDILTFLLDIRIKNYSAENGEKARETFYEIYRRIVRVCTELIYCQSAIVLTRLPQFVYVFQELIKALVSYRSDRLKLSDLDSGEIEKLASMGYDLENLMHGVTKYPLEMKRLAPYLLIFIINATIVNNKSTIRYPKIKLHVENICYELISMCDHRVGGFILRVSNDATRQIYENLCKDYEKYRKFKGKM